MIKINLKSDEQIVKNYIDQIKSNPLVSDYDINLNNVNDFALFIEEFNHCKACKGLSVCKNTNIGFISKPEDDTFVMHPCKYKKEAEMKSKEHQLIKTLFVSKRILIASLEQFELTTPNRRKIFDYIADFIQKMKNNVFSKGLYIYGNFATGKTFILGCIANELAKHHISSLVIYFPDLVVELKNAIGTPRFEELMNYLKSVEVLLLDDLGSENMTPWLRDEVLGPVLNYRLMEEKPIFISSNMDPNTEIIDSNTEKNDLLNHFSLESDSSDLKSKRIKSRLMGLVNAIELENASYKR